MKKVIIFLFGLSIFSISFAQPLFDFMAKVVKIYDGDTLRVEHFTGTSLVDTKIRILGIDAPELYHTGMVVKDYKFYGCGKEAKQIADKFLLNKDVKIYSDNLAKNKGKYDRLLRYIYIGLPYKGKTVYLPFGAIMVYLGYARVYEYENFTYKKLYEKLQKMAQTAHRGMWSEKCQLEDQKIKEAYKKLQIQKEQEELKRQQEKIQQTLNSISQNKKTPTTTGTQTKINQPSRINLNLPCPTIAYCSRIQTCDEAKYYLNKCHIYRLDKDGDGIPCENLCGE